MGKKQASEHSPFFKSQGVAWTELIVFNWNCKSSDRHLLLIILGFHYSIWSHYVALRRRKFSFSSSHAINKLVVMKTSHKECFGEILWDFIAMIK